MSAGRPRPHTGAGLGPTPFHEFGRGTQKTLNRVDCLQDNGLGTVQLDQRSLLVTLEGIETAPPNLCQRAQGGTATSQHPL